MKRSLVLLMLLGILLVGQAFASGPFGFEYGMTREQVIQLVGKQAIKEPREDGFILTTAPKPHSAFELYRLVISPEKGLLKIVAGGNSVQTNGYGEQLKQAYAAVVDGVTQKYGTPTTTLDYLPPGSIWQEPQYWLMGLLRKERKLQAFWELKKPVNHVTLIEIEAFAYSGADSGFVICSFEFEGFDDYATAKEAKQNDNF
jgi:hypothetical protein